MNAPQIGHNSSSTVEKLKEYVFQYVDCDQQSAVINDKRASIREMVADLGLDTKAFQDAVSRAKKDLSKKEGYDESIATMKMALAEIDQIDLFGWMAERKERKAAEREDRKAKADSFKPAEDRKPSKVVKVDFKAAAAGDNE